MKIAVIDIGTNTFNLLICSSSNEKLVLEHVEKEFVFLGKGGINKNMIQADAFERGLDTLKSFSKKAEKKGVSEIIAVATSAVRNARNGNEFAEEVLNTTGIKLNIIPGDLEAEYIYKGAKSATNFGNSPLLLMDIGGGSTEFIICNKDKIFWKQSFEIGVVRLFEKFHKNDPITHQEINNIEKYLLVKMSPLFKALNQYKVDTLIGSAGAFTSLAKMIVASNNSTRKLNKTSEYQFDINKFQEIHDFIINTKLDERLKIPGLVKQRASLIVTGTILVNFILHQFKIKNFKLARYALKEGVASDYFMNL
jgi:exopolyphosphatase/guanosine-5'-triphosphate,3'-diphosphate pyrophosphatase